MISRFDTNLQICKIVSISRVCSNKYFVLKFGFSCQYESICNPVRLAKWFGVEETQN